MITAEKSQQKRLGCDDLCTQIFYTKIRLDMKQIIQPFIYETTTQAPLKAKFDSFSQHF